MQRGMPSFCIISSTACTTQANVPDSSDDGYFSYSFTLRTYISQKNAGKKVWIIRQSLAGQSKSSNDATFGCWDPPAGDEK